MSSQQAPSQSASRNQRRRPWLLIALPSLPAMLIAVVLTFTATNDPWPTGMAAEETFFTSYSSSIKSLDPAVSYYVHEGEILDSIVEMPLSYHYLRRPYELCPMLAGALPVPRYIGHDDAILSGDPPPEQVARVEYDIELKRGIRYQPHPCFAKNSDGTPRYRQLSARDLKGIRHIGDFPAQDSRELHAEDFKVALVRLCDVRLASPVYSTLKSFILGMDECSAHIKNDLAVLEAAASRAGRDIGMYPVLPDYRHYDLAGLQVIDQYRFRLVLSRKYPQAVYWLAMHFFAPMPWEALAFYQQPAVIDARLDIKNWPVGTGAYMMAECAPADHITLVKNPNFRHEPYPNDGSDEQRRNGLLDDAGKTTPFIKRVVFQFEREAIPTWIKFLQGYYDNSGIPNDMFDAAVAMNPNGELSLSQDMIQRGIRLNTGVAPTIFYFGFNMLDPVVGGNSPNQKKLRQAISIALDYQEFIDIFLNGRGVVAQSLIPPGITGAPADGPSGVNPFVDTWNERHQAPQRRPIDDARKLLAEAGYPNGIGPDGAPLTLYLDHANAGQSAFKAQFQWLCRRFELLGIRIQERPSDLNRWRDKVNTGNWQIIFNKGWLADYPDPENFLFLFYSGNGVVSSGGRGANYVNYSSEAFDKVFKQLESMADGPERLALIQQAIRILQEDAPCCWGFHPKNFILTHAWLHNYQPHEMGKTFLKYRRVDAAQRRQCQRAWNRPRLAGIYAVLALVAASASAMIVRIYREDQS
ncbi:MAG: ABC transporter substrate-binding protein [Lentisphaeria bacterium]|jgi:oligopeptide transport system substrate-binding protein